jgi:SAM-dependent methyltransferase
MSTADPRHPSDPPDRISGETLAHYEHNAEAFWAGTRGHDVSQNIGALLQAIEGKPPYTILDFGCGPGRDLKAFTELGHVAVGLEGTPAFVRMAVAYSGCTVWQQDFLALDLPDAYFDGIYANASLFHVPSARLPEVLGRLHRSLKPRGVLFASNPRGNNEEGWNGGRYGVYYDLERWRSLVGAAGFEALGHYYRPPDLPREQQPWLATIWRRAGKALHAGGTKEAR